MMKTRLFFKTLMIVLPILVLAPKAYAAGGNEVLDPVHIDSNDIPSLQRGAALFANYCLSCHSAQYMRYERLSADLDIPLDILQDELMFTTDKPGDLMVTSMTEDIAREWFGVAPPDLTLVSRVRKNDWLYTYLRAFYLDENSPSGWNNSLFENVAMPHVLYELQGAQRLVGHVEAVDDGAGAAHAADDGPQQYIVGDAIFELQTVGKRTPEEFDEDMKDLVNFLSYLAEPAQLQRRVVGVYVMVFLILLLGISLMLKKEYWRDVH